MFVKKFLRLDNALKIDSEAKVWIKRANGYTEVIEILSETDGLVYNLYIAFEKRSDLVGRILFDTEGYWIYDGNILTVEEQEQVARFIINYAERF